MTEREAQRWVAARYPAHTETIARFLAMVIAENKRQNLIAPSTVGQIWHRHAIDSLQLIEYGSPQGRWVDVGTGGGFPGMMAAIVRPGPTTLIEPRRKRADFMRDAALHLGLKDLDVIQRRAETVDITAMTISARAVAPIEQLLAAGFRWSSSTTRWILPRGTLSEDDMTILRRRFAAMFHVERSLTSAGSSIVVAEGRPK